MWQLWTHFARPKTPFGLRGLSVYYQIATDEWNGVVKPVFLDTQIDNITQAIQKIENGAPGIEFRWVKIHSQLQFGKVTTLERWMEATQSSIWSSQVWLSRHMAASPRGRQGSSCQSWVGWMPYHRQNSTWNTPRPWFEIPSCAFLFIKVPRMSTWDWTEMVLSRYFFRMYKLALKRIFRPRAQMHTACIGPPSGGVGLDVPSWEVIKSLWNKG